MRLSKLIVAVAIILMCGVFANVNAVISGKVYQDYGQNGVFDNDVYLSDAGVAGIVVNAYDDSNSVVASATTDANGDYSLATNVGNYRIEFSSIPTNFSTGTAIAGSTQPFVSTVADGATYDVGLIQANSFCQNNPKVAMALQVAGVNQTFPTLFDAPALVTGTTVTVNANVSMDASGSASSVVSSHDVIVNYNKNVRTQRAIGTDTGSIWGLAWDKNTKKLYTAAVIRRWSKIKNADAGAIYVTDDTNTTNLLTSIANVGYLSVADDAARDLVRDNWQDTQVIPLIGRKGLGGLEINEDGSELYVINLNTKSLITIDLTNPTTHTINAIPNPYAVSDCADANVRPWALKVKGNKRYIGSVCETNTVLGARVQEFNGTTFTVIASTNRLVYEKNSTTTPSIHWSGYRYQASWSDSQYRPQPILGDIEFDNNRDLILGYVDRMSFFGGSPASGDTRRMCYDPANAVGGDYVDEIDNTNNPTSCGTHMTMYSATDRDKQYIEFYSGDYHKVYFTSHPENSSGGLAMFAGSKNVFAPIYDANQVYDQGFVSMSNTTGFKVTNQVIADQGEGNGHYYAKAGGIGDMEILCDPAPLEIGNIVWNDSDLDGIQDPSETSLTGVVVDLFESGVQVGTATTQSDGSYYFGGLSNTNMLGGNTLKENTAYQLRVSLSDTVLTTNNL